jgi:hypothetical protein
MIKEIVETKRMSLEQSGFEKDISSKSDRHLKSAA